MTMPTAVSLLALIYVPILVGAIEPAAVQRNVCVPGWLRGRIKPVNPRTTIADYISQDPARRAALAHILGHYKTLEQRVDYTGDSKCAREGQYALKSVATLVRYFGWGTFFGCYTKLVAEDNVTKLFKSLRILRSAAAETGKTFLQEKQREPKVWFKNGATENGLFEHTDDRVFSRCIIARSLAYRVHSTWKLALDFTNAPPQDSLPDWKRAYYTEAIYMGKDGKMVRNFPFNVRNCTTDANKPEYRGKATVSLWGGSPKWSAFLTSDLEDNPALQRTLHSLNDNDYVKGQVEESYRLSSMVILVLPSIYALVPVSFYSNIDDVCGALYVILADLCSVIPTIVKGVELLIFYNRKRHTTISHVYGHPDSPVMAAETWVSSCQLSTSVRTTGIGLIVWAIASFVLGLLFESLARERMLKDKFFFEAVLSNYLRSQDSGLMGATSRFIGTYFTENPAGGMFWYFGAVKCISREENQDSIWENTKRKFTSWCFRPPGSILILRKAWNIEDLD